MELIHSKRDIFIVADDLGLAKSVNEGIFFAFKNGLIGGASLMANGLAFEHAIAGSRETLDLKLGIHLVLVEEKPLTLIKLPKNHKTFFIRYVFGLIKKNEIERELEAQINKILDAGIRPQFINSHQHLHLLPGIMDIVISLAKKYGIPYIRIVNEPLAAGGNLLRKVQLGFLNFLSGNAKKEITRNNLKCNDFFVGFLHAGNLGKNDVSLAIKLQSKYLGKIVELGCHPGFESPELIDKYKNWGGYHWKREIKILNNYFNIVLCYKS